MIKLQEKDYETEVTKLQSDLVEEHIQFMEKRQKLEDEDTDLK